MSNNSTQQALTPGTLLRGNTYRIETILGQGGFGITYLATDLTLDLKVAIKEFFPKDYCDRNSSTSHVTLGTSSTGEFVERLKAKFLKEAVNIAKFKNPSIIRILAAFEENNTAYYVMEHIEGATLSEIVKRSGPIDPDRAMEYIKKIGNALDYIHAKKINHLDVKPANIMVRSSDNEPILIDFGLSKQYDREGNQTSTTPTGISHGYAPLEQYKAGGLKEFSPQTDLYSLAATLYYILTGVVPPQAPDLVEEDLTFPETIPSPMIPAISKAMSSGRKQRHGSVKEFIDDLKRKELPSDETVIPHPVPQEEDVTIINVAESEKKAPEPEIKVEVMKPQKIEEKKKLSEPSEKKVGEKVERKEASNTQARNEAPRPEKKKPEPSKPEPLIPKPRKPIGVDEWPKPPLPKKDRSWIKYTVAVGCVVAAGVLILLFVIPSNKVGAPKPTDIAALSTPEETEKNAEAENVVTMQSNEVNMPWESPLGSALYTGSVLVTPNGNVPDGKGVATIVDGKFKGCIYDGEFVVGLMEGETTYTCSNGDIFKGTFHDNKYDKGRYTIKSDGSYFEGTFKNSLPDQGKWYNKSGKEI